MSNLHLTRKPSFLRLGRHATKALWVYETSGGLQLVGSPSGSYQHGLIPWRKVRAALARKDRKS